MLEIAVIDGGWTKGPDWDAIAGRAASAAIAVSCCPQLAMIDTAVEIAVRLAFDDDVQTLNRDYRQKDKATNVLSFPMYAPDEIAAVADSSGPEILLGDIVLGEGVCQREADERGISLESHATHLIVHGVLHLLGYDHIGDEEAEEMEALERRIMHTLSLHDPYED